jgi:hypothetical protein
MQAPVSREDEAGFLAVLIEQTASALDAPWACLWLADETRSLTRKALYSRVIGVRLPRRLEADSLIGQVAFGGQPVRLADAAADPNWKRAQFSETSGMRALVAAPLGNPAASRRDGPGALWHGVVEVMREADRPFTNHDEELLSATAQLAGRILYQARRAASAEELATALTERAARMARASAAELADLDQALSSSVAGLPIAVFEIGASGVFRRAIVGEPALLATMPEMVGRSVREVFSHSPELASQVERALSGEPQRGEDRLVEGGQTYEVVWQPLRDFAGRVRGVRGVAVPRRTAPRLVSAIEAEFEQLADQLTAAIGYSELLSRDPELRREQREYAEGAYRAASQAGELVTRIVEALQRLRT